MHPFAAHLLTLCLINASEANHIPPNIAASILYVEGGKVGSISKNKNGSEDLGVMQINSSAWLSIISKALFDGDEKLAYHELVYDPCLNIKVGVWILSLERKSVGGDIWKAVGRYHSRNPEIASFYINKVKRVNDMFFNNFF